jgi:hypothetical protein
VLTDITEAESTLALPAESEGKFFVRDINGMLVSEINKIKGTGVSLALEAGIYTIVLVTPKTTMEGVVDIGRGQHLTLNPRDLSAVQKTYARSRGNAESENRGIPDDAEYVPLAISIFPGVSYPFEQDNAPRFHWTVHGIEQEYQGRPGNVLHGIVNNDIEGVQGSGFMNIAKGSVDGIQGAGS